MMKQVTSGIKGLDNVLNGGFLRPSAILIAGTAGTGKTTFVMQSLFNAAENEEICMYITALSEPITMLNSFMSKFSFYDLTLLENNNVTYVPINLETINRGVGAIINEMEKKIEKVKPDRIAIDPVNVFAFGMNEASQRRFYYDFFNRIKRWNSLVLLTGEYTMESLIRSTLSYLVDGIIYMSAHQSHERNIRYLNVLKMRGQEFCSGRHSYRITKDGLMVFPRLSYNTRVHVSTQRVSTGIKGLDRMTNGGFIRGSSILLSGSSGTGKSVIGMQFIMDGVLKNEAGVVVSFEEDAAQIRENSRKMGWNLEEFENKHVLKILTPFEFDVYEFANQLKEEVEEINAKRVLFDGTSRLQRMLPEYAQLPEYMSEIINYLKNRNITAIYTSETSNLTGATSITGTGISPLMDTVILLRYVEIKSEMRKVISVLKMRGSNHDKQIREMVISEKGGEIKLPFSEYSGILSGSPTKTPSDAFVEAFKKNHE